MGPRRHTGEAEDSRAARAPSNLSRIWAGFRDFCGDGSCGYWRGHVSQVLDGIWDGRVDGDIQERGEDDKEKEDGETGEHPSPPIMPR